MTFRRCSRVIIDDRNHRDIDTPNSFCSMGCDDQLRGDAAEQAAAGGRDLEQHAEAMLISCFPARAAETELDVAITVVRLIAAATGNEKFRPRVRKGTRKIPPAKAEQRSRSPRRRLPQ